MAIFTIGDLHLSFDTNKPMNVFGENWNNYEEKIKQNWIENVTEKDTVILPGDFSWAMYLNETRKDFEYLNSLPGKKLLLKGNHDYWWSTLTSMRNYLKQEGFENIDFLINNSYEVENKIICGTRGWIISDEQEDKRLTKREEDRLELSIQNGIREYTQGQNCNYEEQHEIIVFMHYPPITRNFMKTRYIDIMKKYNVHRCYYGHLHSTSIQSAVEGNVEGIQFKLVSADGLDFKLLKI